MGASNEKQKKSKAGKLDIPGRWTPLPNVVIHSQEYRKISHAACRLQRRRRPSLDRLGRSVSHVTPGRVRGPSHLRRSLFLAGR